MSIVERLTRFVQSVFKTTLEIFLEALKQSPNAQGYVSGSVTELLLKKEMEHRGFEVHRIREKWEGVKHPQHHGDFYIRQTSASPWYVLESKGVKSNSEKWHKLYNRGHLESFLQKHHAMLDWIVQNQPVEVQIRDWLSSSLPRFDSEYEEDLYDYEEIQKYSRSMPRRETVKSRRIAALRGYSRGEIARMIDERLGYLMSKCRVLETHFVSQESESSGRTQATPRKDEFNLISVDIFLRYSSHRFLYANPNHLDSSGQDANHLQQNYIIGFVFLEADGKERISISEEWTEEFYDVYQSLTAAVSVQEGDMQVDHRYIADIEDEAGNE